MTDVWKQTVDDGMFECRVTRSDDPYRGILVVTVVSTGEVLLAEPVGLSYGAQFGPDIADVADWQERALGPIDAYLESHEPV